MTLAVGDPAPDFDLPTDGGGHAKLADYKGRKLVLYFYPKDDTTGCTSEANGFSELAGEFAKAGTTVIGVSKDSVKSHDKFKAKYGLDIILASDVEGKVVEAYGVLGGKEPVRPQVHGHRPLHLPDRWPGPHPQGLA